MRYWGLDQGLAGGLLRAEALEILLERLSLGVGRVDQPIAGRDPMPSRWRHLETGVGEHRPGLGRADRTLRNRHAVLIQLGVDPLTPHASLVDQRDVQAHPLSPLQHARRRNP
jgi:hypothetical protein